MPRPGAPLLSLELEGTEPKTGGHAMYVIAGVTGHTGKIAADTLLDKKQPVRVIVRKPEQGAFVLLPPDPTTSDYLGSRARLTQAITSAVGKAKLPHVVLLSSIGAHIPRGTGPIAALHAAERSLEKSGAQTTFVRAAYFLE